jgi:hypothetical protein
MSAAGAPDIAIFLHASRGTGEPGEPGNGTGYGAGVGDVSYNSASPLHSEGEGKRIVERRENREERIKDKI